MDMIPIPEELLEQFERGNALLFIGERVVRDADGQALVDRLSAELAARCRAAGEGELSFLQAAQAYEDSRRSARSPGCTSATCWSPPALTGGWSAPLRRRSAR
jgi:hypothetical protein